MPRTRHPTSGYARIAQEEEHNPTIYSDDSDDDGPHKAPTTISSSLAQYASIQPKKNTTMDSSVSDHRKYGDRRRRIRSNSSGVDIKAINARLEKWADEIASKFKIGKRRGGSEGQESLEIIHSVFQAPEGMRPTTAETLDSQYLDSSTDRMTKAGFEEVVETVRVAIEMGMHPTMISQGSSGSYFARNTEGTIVGVFKPKDEEPYASRNPKWTKWLHRNLFPCFFGRACLIPNLSYVSEAAAYVLDDQLHTNLVPYTDIVHLSSKSFFYEFWDRRNFYRKRKPFPSKIGSFQVFLKGFKDANIFLRDNPWPDQQQSAFGVNGSARKKSRSWNDSCRPSGAPSDDEGSEDEHSEPSIEETHQRKFFWTDALQTSFREELEKLVILDYIMRNTDRGLDNWMIKIDWETQRVSIAAEPPQMNGSTSEDPPPRPVPARENGEGSSLEPPRVYSYRKQQPMDPVSRSATPVESSNNTTVSVGAIDNSLSWPWKHPDAVSGL
jgi:phosphatidylinositol 4-kinase type 2